MPKKRVDHTAKLPDLARMLDELPDVSAGPGRTDTQRYLIERLRGSLVAAIAERGYTVASLARHLRAKGIDITVSTLHRYLGHTRPYRAAYRRRQGLSDPADPGAEPGGGNGRWPPTGASPEAVAQREAALAETFSTAATTAPAATAPDAPAPPARGTFAPRPERPIDWLPKKTGSP